MVLRGTGAIASDAEDPFYVNGNWYVAQEGVVAAGVAAGTGLIRLMPFRIRQLVSIQQLGARISTLAAGGLAQLGIYAAQKDTLLPTGQVLARTASIPTDTAGPIAGPLFDNAGNAIATKQLPRGVYWFGSQVDATAGGTIIMVSMGAGTTFMSNLTGALSQAIALASASTAIWIKFLNAAYGTWPDLTNPAATAESSSNAGAIGMFQVAP